MPDNALRQGEPRRVVRLFPDYGHDWPLWENGTEWRETAYTMQPADYGLSAELTSAMRSWQDIWESHFRAPDRWDSPARAREWREQGRTVAAMLQKEIADWGDVEYDGVEY